MNVTERLKFWDEEYHRVSSVTRRYEDVFHVNGTEDDVEVLRCLSDLNTVLNRISDSMVELALGRRLWEATILSRTEVEGTTKLLFMCTTDPVERRKRVKEFDDELPDVSGLRDHRRAKAYLESFGNPTGVGYQPVRDVMQPDREIERIEKSYSKAQRGRLEQKWSFASMVEDIARSGFPSIEAFTAQLFAYSLSSHILHMDGLGLGAICERAERSEQHRHATELAHAARVIGNQVASAMMRLAYVRWMKGLPFKDVFTESNPKPLLDDLDLANKEWHEIEYPVTSAEERG